MNLLNITDQLFFAVLISTVTGTFMQIIWLLLRELLLRINPMLAYISLRWISVLYIIPFGYFAVLLRYRKWIQGNEGIWRLIFAHTDSMVVIMKVCGVVWFVIASVLVVCRLRKTLVCNHIFRDNVRPDNEEMLSVFGEVRRELNVPNGDVLLKMNVLTGVPMIYKALCPTIVMPDGDYSCEKLKSFFYHELAHYKHRDLWGSSLIVFITVLHCFNPAAFYQLYLVKIWSEYMADLFAIQHMSDKIDSVVIKNYFDMMIDIIPSKDDSQEHESNDERKFKFSFSVLFESTKLLKRRIDFMKKYQKFGKCGKLVTATLSAAFVLMSTTSAFAAGDAVTDTYSDYYQETEDTFQEGDRIAEDGMVEHYCNIEDLNIDDLTIVEERPSLISPYSSSYDETWQVNPKTRHVGGNFIVKAGGIIGVASVVKPLDKTYWLGIMDDDGHARYVSGAGALSHEFKISTTNHYWVFIQNNYTNVTFSAGICYAYRN